ncbi:MAG: HAD-IIIA family hydrolase [Elusimicrobia bacterium]|nr:HAD-IIIA family hydrolase [Elusimicrobiota bacterium]
MARDKVVFLDRDGTLIWDRPGFYLRRPEQIRLYRSTPEALRLLRRAGYRLVVVSNQSGIGRGFLDHAMLKRIHARLRRELRARRARLDAIYFCPHRPDDACRCRKPLPTLARRAVRELRLTLKGAAMIGDKKADVDLAAALGIPSVLVRTGHARRQKRSFGRGVRPTHEARDILAAARWVVRSLGAACALAALGAGAASAEPAGTPRLRLSSPTLADPSQLLGQALPDSPAYARVPWQPPEFLEYEVKWGILAVGTSNLQTKRVVDFNGTPAFHIVSEAKSSPFCDRFYPVRDINESWIDAVTLQSLGYSKKLREGAFFRDEWVLYDYPDKRFLAKTTNKDGQFSYANGAIPGGVQDILSSLFFVRSKELTVGSEIIVDVNTKQNWPLVIKVVRKKTLEVPAGRFRTVEVEPFLRDEGIFIQKGKRLQIWLTDDDRKLPVRMSVEVIFGNVTASLQKIGRSPARR